jgi:surface antigen
VGFPTKEVKAQEEVVITYEPMEALEADIGVADALYKEWLKEQAKPKKPLKTAKTGSKVPSTSYCSCVLFAKSLTGYSKLVGNAINWPKNSKVPMVGGVVVTNESRAGHVAVITAVRDGEFDIVEANYSRCRKGVRTLKINNPVILGYWQQT